MLTNIIIRRWNLRMVGYGSNGIFLSLRDRTVWVGEAFWSGTGCHCPLQSLLIRPPVDEVSMQTETSLIAHCIYPVREIGVGLGVIYEFQEDGIDGDGVGFGADAFVIIADCRIGHLD